MFKKNKKYNYFEGFHAFSKYTLQAANLLSEIISDFDVSNLEEQRIAMHKIENDCDIHKHAMNEVLFREFLPPIEAEDIVEMTHRLDNIVDAIEDILIGIYMFNVTKVRNNAIEFTKIIVDLANAQFKATEDFIHFKGSKTIDNNLKEIKRLEQLADDIYIEEMHRLHVEEDNIKKLLVWTRIYDRFENAADEFESVSKMMETIIIKNT